MFTCLLRIAYDESAVESVRERRLALCKRDQQQQAKFREPVWPSGKAVGLYAEGPRFDTASALLSLQKLWFVDTVL